MRLVLVERRARDLGVGHERRQHAVGAGVGEHLEIEVGQRHNRADVVLAAQLGERRDVRGIVDPRHRHASVRGVLGRRERVGIGGDRERVLGERRDDVVALADAREQHPYVCHPPVSPL